MLEHDREHVGEDEELEEQAKEIDDALKKGGDKESQAAQQGKIKYVG